MKRRVVLVCCPKASRSFPSMENYYVITQLVLRARMLSTRRLELLQVAQLLIYIPLT
jgi:hypothetical protein